MAEKKIFAGARLRRLRRTNGLTQLAMAEMLAISASYLNLIERNQRPLTAALMLRLADLFDFDPRVLAAEEPGGGEDALRRRLSDPLFADLEIDRAELQEWLSAAPGGAEAFARVFDRLRESGGERAADENDALAASRREIERWRNHFADLDMQAEAIADELRMGSADLYGAIAERLRSRHQLSVRIMPTDVMPDRLRRLDLHARQLQLSEMLDSSSRAFQLAYQLGLLEAKTEIDGLVAGGQFTDRAAERLFRRHLCSYFAAALLMPYGRFLRACEASGYDFELLQRRFNVSFEMVGHRLTTLQRVGARGLPFFMLRIDRAGQASKRFVGASGAPLIEAGERCPLWRIHAAFDHGGGQPISHLVELEDGSRWLSFARVAHPPVRTTGGIKAEFVVAIGLSANLAGTLADARGLDLSRGTPIGLGCRRCLRADCPQRSLAPVGRALILNERERGLTPFAFIGD
jgi:predicted transcriptional regulator/DNA-binding XRE family transcriptional regulator